jgi:hypothetical protein
MHVNVNGVGLWRWKIAKATCEMGSFKFYLMVYYNAYLKYLSVLFLHGERRVNSSPLYTLSVFSQNEGEFMVGVCHEPWLPDSQRQFSSRRVTPCVWYPLITMHDARFSYLLIDFSGHRPPPGNTRTWKSLSNEAIYFTRFVLSLESCPLKKILYETVLLRSSAVWRRVMWQFVSGEHIASIFRAE